MKTRFFALAALFLPALSCSNVQAKRIGRFHGVPLHSFTKPHRMTTLLPSHFAFALIGGSVLADAQACDPSIALGLLSATYKPALVPRCNGQLCLRA